MILRAFIVIQISRGCGVAVPLLGQCHFACVSPEVILEESLHVRPDRLLPGQNEQARILFYSTAQKRYYNLATIVFVFIFFLDNR